MDGHRQPHAVPGLKNLPANGSDRYGATEQAAGGGGPQGDHEFRLDDRALEIVPPPAAFDLVGVRPLVQPALAAQLELEMLHRVGDEHLVAVESRVRQGPVQHTACRSDERLAGDVLVGSRLLADQHQCRRSRALPGNDLRGIAIERTARALGFRVASPIPLPSSKTAGRPQGSSTEVRARYCEQPLGPRNCNCYSAPAICGSGEESEHGPVAAAGDGCAGDGARCRFCPACRRGASAPDRQGRDGGLALRCSRGTPAHHIGRLAGTLRHAIGRQWPAGRAAAAVRLPARPAAPRRPAQRRGAPATPGIVRVAPNGDIFIAETQAGRIRVLRTPEGATRPDRIETFASRLNEPFGLAFYPPGADPEWLYVADTDAVLR